MLILYERIIKAKMAYIAEASRFVARSMHRVRCLLAVLAAAALAACQAPISSVPTPVTLDPPAPATTDRPAATAPVPTAAPAPTPTAPPPLPTVPVLLRALALEAPRQQGEDVRRVQQRLAELGYRQVGELDGIFGPATEAAVRAFQQQHDLVVDGIVSPQTWARLFSAEASGPIRPIVIAGPNWLLGASSDAGWIAGAAAAGVLVGGEQYQVAGADVATGAQPEPIDRDICPASFAVALRPAPSDRQAIAVAGDWKLTPRQPIEQDPAAYRQAVATLLQERGIAEPEVQITSALQIDLDNDGSSEIVISAARDRDNTLTPSADAGDYSLILVQRRLGERVVLVEVVGNIYPASAEFIAPQAHRLLGIHDLNGNGAMEVVVFSQYYEGAYATAYTLNGALAEAVLTTGCGV